MKRVEAGASHAQASPGVEVTQTGGGRCTVRGALTFATARRAREIGERCLAASAAAGDIELDCQGVTAADSAGLAVLLDWLALVSRKGRTLRFVGLPVELRAIARISEVEELLGLPPEEPPPRP